jgi:hypothetical protein
MVIVSYRLSDGTKGTYTAPTNDLVSAVWMTRDILIADAVEDGTVTAAEARSSFMFVDIATITKAEVAA